MDPVFPSIPDDLTSLSDDELRALEEQHVDLARRVRALDPELIPEGTTDTDVLQVMRGGVEAVGRIRAELQARTEAAAALETELAALAEGLEPVAEEPAPEPAPDPDAPAPPGDPEAAAEPAEEPEAVLAAAEPTPTPRRLPARPVAHEPAVAAGPRMTVATEGLGLPLGAPVQPDQLGRLFVDKRQQLGRGVVADGSTIPIVKIDATGDATRLDAADDGANNWRTVEQQLEPLLASGGLCAPVTPYYDLAMFSESARPVRDSLPRFNADRGGIRFLTPPALSAVTTAVGRITAANDALGGTSATKTCQTVSCPGQVEVDVAIVFHCLRFGNLGTRAWPEQVAQFQQLTMAAWARTAETALLDGIAASSTVVTGAQVGGAVNTLLGQILTAAAGQRNRHRMDPERTLRVLLPAWSRELLVTDIIRSQFQRFDQSLNGVVALLRSFNVEPTFYIDGPSGGSQVFGAQGGGALLGFPSTVRWFLFPEGSFLWLDSGSLELGIVRDSTLNATNDYTIFGESFENIAFLGVESLQVTSTVCATGEVTLPRTLSCAVGP